MKGQDDGHNWRILLTGTNNGEIGDEKACSQEADARADLKDLKAASNSCSSAQRKAQISLTTLKSERLSFQDMETARRVARALMHMTLLCGGAKAVSPF